MSFADDLLERLNNCDLPDLSLDDSGNLVCPIGIILDRTDGETDTLNFFLYDQREEPAEYKRAGSLISLSYPHDLNLMEHIYIRRSGSYSLSYLNVFNQIVNNQRRSLKHLVINHSSEVLASWRGTTLTLSTKTFIDAMTEAKGIYKQQGSFKASIGGYLSKQSAAKIGIKTTKGQTTYAKVGEATFFIDRLNLPTKKKAKDFRKYLDDKDIASLEILSDKLVRHSVFSDDFISKLDAYFIKHKLEDIIAKGRDILSLGKDSLDTQKAKRIKESLQLKEDAKSLEELWQKYFEKYLLYLFFSYKKIIPHVPLVCPDTIDKKYPDFLGVNHYNGVDVIEIKTHLTPMLVWDKSHKNFHFSADMSKAIVQTINYMDAVAQDKFKQDDKKQEIIKAGGKDNLYRPRGIIIASSNRVLASKAGEDQLMNRDFTKLRNSINNIQILTFEEILDIADNYSRNIIGRQPNLEEIH